MTYYAKALREALIKRGHTPTQIAKMTPEEKFDEYCEWHGLLGHGPTLRAIHKAAKVKS